jgi:hypothetical protein
MKIKTEDLTGAALDWAVAKCMGYVEQGVYGPPEFRDSEVYLCYCGAVLNSCYSPTTDWAQGGPIIERERISIRQWTNVPLVHAYMPQDDAPWVSDGTSPLIAAMRAYVSSRLGDEVEVPEELTCSPTPKND